MSTHTLIYSLYNALGYNNSKGGCCRGVTLRWLEACMLNEEHVFTKRINLIHSQKLSLVTSLHYVKNKVREKQPLTQEEWDLLDVVAFYDGVELYQSSPMLSSFFNAYTQRCNIDSISVLASSDGITNRGGLATIYSEPFIYNGEEIKSYLDEIGRVIESSDYSSKDVLGILLSNADHAIGLTYQPQVGWNFMDINQYPSKAFAQQQTQDITKKIANGFKTRNNTDYIAFNVNVLTTTNHRHRALLAEKLETFKKSHLITDEIAQRTEQVNLMWIVTKNNHNDLISILIKMGSDINTANHLELTPVHIAALNGNATIITALWEAGADMNRKNKYGITPIYCAAQEGHTAIIKLLIHMGADLNIAKKDGATPLFIAAQRNHIESYKVLAAYQANLKTPLIKAAIHLREFASKHEALVIDRMNQLIQRQLNTGNDPNIISITPCDIAWVMGNTEIFGLIQIQSKKQTTSPSLGFFDQDRAKKRLKMTDKSAENIGLLHKGMW